MFNKLYLIKNKYINKTFTNSNASVRFSVLLIE